MIVLVTGQLIVSLRSLPSLLRTVTHPLILYATRQTGDESNALNFSQTFHLVPEGAGYYVLVHRASVTELFTESLVRMTGTTTSSD